MPDGANAGLTQLRAWLAQGGIAIDSRLPPERELCALLGLSRGELRKALQVLECEGRLWRQVGKGTFVGIKPAAEFSSLASVVASSSPGEVMQARLTFEPILAAEAALYANREHLESMQLCVTASRSAQTWREYETCDNRFHRTIAEASGNTVLTAMFDHLNAIRRAVVWSRTRDQSDRPPSSHHSFDEHDFLLEKISDRDVEGARAAMKAHLETVSALLQQKVRAAE